MLDQSILSIAFLLAVANNAIIDYIADPVRKHYPNIDLWFLPYIALATGFVIGYLADINLFTIAPGLTGSAGRVLTAAVIGGGSKLLHDITDHPDVAQ